MGGSVPIGSLLTILLATGIVVPVLTAVRLFIIIRGSRARKEYVGKLSATYFGEGFLVAVAVFNTVETVLWMWNTIKELRNGGPGGVGAIDERYLQRTFWASVTYVVHLWTLKGAFLSLYYDLVPTLNWKSRWLLYVTTGLTILSFQGVIAGQMVFCKPIARNWSMGPDFCTHITSKKWIMASSWANIATDLLISSIPLCIISTLKLTSRERYGFMAIYALGSLSVLASILRFSVLNHDANKQSPNTHFASSQTPSLEHPFDTDAKRWLKTLHAVILWSTVEVLCAHICFCIPAFRVLVRKKRRASAASDDIGRCVESRNTIRHTPVAGGGGEWFDYNAISPLESSPNTPLTAGGERIDRRSWTMRWSDIGAMEARVGDRTSPWTLEDMGLGGGDRGSRGSRGWIPVPSEERESTEDEVRR